MLNGSQAGAADGFDISAGNCVIKGLVINRFQQTGLVLEGHGGNLVEGNYIGTNAAGSASVIFQHQIVAIFVAN